MLCRPLFYFPKFNFQYYQGILPRLKSLKRKIPQIPYKLRLNLEDVVENRVNYLYCQLKRPGFNYIEYARYHYNQTKKSKKCCKKIF